MEEELEFVDAFLNDEQENSIEHLLEQTYARHRVERLRQKGKQKASPQKDEMEIDVITKSLSNENLASMASSSSSSSSSRSSSAMSIENNLKRTRQQTFPKQQLEPQKKQSLPKYGGLTYIQATPMPNQFALELQLKTQQQKLRAHANVFTNSPLEFSDDHLFKRANLHPELEKQKEQQLLETKAESSSQPEQILPPIPGWKFQIGESLSDADKRLVELYKGDESDVGLTTLTRMGEVQHLKHQKQFKPEEALENIEFEGPKPIEFKVWLEFIPDSKLDGILTPELVQYFAVAAGDTYEYRYEEKTLASALSEGDQPLQGQEELERDAKKIAQFQEKWGKKGLHYITLVGQFTYYLQSGKKLPSLIDTTTKSVPKKERALLSLIYASAKQFYNRWIQSLNEFRYIWQDTRQIFEQLVSQAASELSVAVEVWSTEGLTRNTLLQQVPFRLLAQNLIEQIVSISEVLDKTIAQDVQTEQFYGGYAQIYSALEQVLKLDVDEQKSFDIQDYIDTLVKKAKETPTEDENEFLDILRSNDELIDVTERIRKFQQETITKPDETGTTFATETVLGARLLLNTATLLKGLIAVDTKDYFKDNTVFGVSGTDIAALVDEESGALILSVIVQNLLPPSIPTDSTEANIKKEAREYYKFLVGMMNTSGAIRIELQENQSEDKRTQYDELKELAINTVGRLKNITELDNDFLMLQLIENELSVTLHYILSNSEAYPKVRDVNELGDTYWQEDAKERIVEALSQKLVQFVELVVPYTPYAFEELFGDLEITDELAKLAISGTSISQRYQVRGLVEQRFNLPTPNISTFKLEAKDLLDAYQPIIQVLSNNNLTQGFKADFLSQLGIVYGNEQTTRTVFTQSVKLIKPALFLAINVVLENINKRREKQGRKRVTFKKVLDQGDLIPLAYLTGQELRKNADYKGGKQPRALSTQEQLQRDISITAQYEAISKQNLVPSDTF